MLKKELNLSTITFNVWFCHFTLQGDTKNQLKVTFKGQKLTKILLTKKEKKK